MIDVASHSPLQPRDLPPSVPLCVSSVMSPASPIHFKFALIRLAEKLKSSLLSVAFTLSCPSMWKGEGSLCSSLFTLFYLFLTRNRLPPGELWTHFDSLTGTFQAFGLCMCWSPFAYSDSMVTAPRRSSSLRPGLYCLCCDHWATPAGLRQFMALSVLRCAGISQFAGLMSVLTQLWKPWPHAAMTETLTHLYGLRTVISRSKGVLKRQRVSFSHFTGIHSLC